MTGDRRGKRTSEEQSCRCPHRPALYECRSIYTLLKSLVRTRRVLCIFADASLQGQALFGSPSLRLPHAESQRSSSSGRRQRRGCFLTWRKGGPAGGDPPVEVDSEGAARKLSQLSRRSLSPTTLHRRLHNLACAPHFRLSPHPFLAQ